MHRLGLVKPPRDLTQADFHAQISDAQLRQVIRVGKGQMPAFGGLMADEDLSNVITFIRSLPPHQHSSNIEGVPNARTPDLAHEALVPAGSEGTATDGLGMAAPLAESHGATAK